MENDSRRDLLHDLILPTLLFMCLGGMTWAVRGCSGFGALKGCTFAGVTWGVGWWFISRYAPAGQRRRYSSAWIVLALTVAIGISGSRGWMQWPSFWRGELMTDAPKNEFVPISRAYGFLWLFIAGMPWAGLGACALAWTSSQRPVRAWEWVLRLASGFGMAYFMSVFLFNTYPEIFLPLYGSIKDRYLDLQANPNLRRLINDNTSAIRHLGFYLGFLLFEVVRRDWKNVKLILTVGVLNGAGWALLQNWSWARNVWPNSDFNFWRCWESSGGISIGLAFGIAYYLVNRPVSDGEPAIEAAPPAHERPDLQWLWAAVLLVALGLIMMVSLEPVSPSYQRALPGPGILAYRNLYLGVGIGCAVLWAVYYLATREMSEEVRRRRKTLFAGLEWIAGYGLMLVFAWFISTQIGTRGLNLGEARGTTPGWLNWLNVHLGNWSDNFFYIAVGYGILVLFSRWATLRMSQAARKLAPDLDALAAYLGLLMVVAVFYTGETRSAWSYHIWLPAVGVVFIFVYDGVAWALSHNENTLQATSAPRRDPNLERWGLAAGLVLGLGLSLKNGLRGWANIYIGNEDYWTQVFWNYIGAVSIGCLVVWGAWIIIRRLPRGFQGDVFPYAYAIVWVVLIHQNVIAQLITGPVTKWNWREQAFSVYYVVLFIITGFIVYHYHARSRRGRAVKVVDYAAPGREEALAP